MKRLIFLLGLISITLFTGQSIGAQSDSGISLPSEWRIVRVVPAPWAAAKQSQESLASWIGKIIQFKSSSVEGPGVLHCDHATLEKTSYVSEGLFQGGLSMPSDAAEEQLGIAHLPLPGVRLNCSTGSFEFHFVDSGTLLLGLNNQILTLSRSPGTLASAMSPEGRMQRLLEIHFNGDMGFTSERAKVYREWFSIRLNHALTAYFSKPNLADEVPAIDGDPFTDSQSYPTRFSVGEAKINGDHAEVRIHFSDAFSGRTIAYVLLREDGSWKLDDVRFERGETFSGLME